MKTFKLFTALALWGICLLTAFNTHAQTCPAPTNFVIVDNQDGSITFSWDATVPAPGLGYAYCVAPSGVTPNPMTDFTLTQTLNITASTTYNGSALVNGVTYNVFIASLCGFSDAGYDNQFITINIPVTSCAPVTALDTLNSDFAAGTIELAFTSSALEFEVQVFDNTLNTNYFLNPNPITNHIVLSGLTHGYNYTVRVRAICGVGDTSSALVKSFDFGNLPCQQPLNVAVVDNYDGTITITWVDPLPAPAQGIAVSVMNQGGFPTDATDITYPVASPYTIGVTNAGATLTHGASYSVYVGSVCDYANNDMAIVSKVVKIFNPAPCDTVENLGAMDNTDGTISISWMAVSPAPGGGYGYAIVPEGESLQPTDFKTTMSTSVLNIATTTQSAAATFINGNTYDIYVRTHCYHNPVWYSDTVMHKILVTNLGMGENDIALTVYPNPATDIIYVNAVNVDLKNATVAVLDITGKVLFTETMAAELTEVNVSNLASGIYFVKAQSEQNYKTVKVVK